MGGGAVASTSSREGTALPLSRLLPHFLSRRRERKSCQQATPGAFRRFPPLHSPPFHSKFGSAPTQTREESTYSHP